MRYKRYRISFIFLPHSWLNPMTTTIYSLFYFVIVALLLLLLRCSNDSICSFSLTCSVVPLQAGDGDKYYRDTQLTETVTSRHTASQYRPVDFRLPVGGGQFGDISGRCALSLSHTHWILIAGGCIIEWTSMDLGWSIVIKKSFTPFFRSLL